MRLDDMAALTEIPRSSLSIYERGVSIPTLYYAEKMAAVVGVSLNRLTPPFAAYGLSRVPTPAPSATEAPSAPGDAPEAPVKSLSEM